MLNNAHLLYMDDLNLFGQMQAQIKGVDWNYHKFQRGYKLKFGLDKCAMVYMTAEEIVASENITMDGKTSEIVEGIQYNNRIISSSHSTI